MEDNNNSDNRAEAERLLGIAKRFLTTRDLYSSQDFARLAQEIAPLNDGSDQILAISDVLIAADTKKINNRHNWYAILQLDSKSDNLDSIKKQYRRLALLLHPDKNKYPFANEAFQLVADAWGVLSDTSRKNVFDHEYGVFTRVNLSATRKQNQEKGYKGGFAGGAAQQQQQTRNFWTMCPYCYNLYEFPRVYKDCCLKCGNCNRAIHATEISTLPPVVEGQDAYYCCWGFFPMGFTGNDDGVGGRAGRGSGRKDSGFPNRAPPVFGVNVNGRDEEFVENSGGNVTPVHRNVNVTPGSTTGAKRGRGRPRKNPL